MDFALIADYAELITGYAIKAIGFLIPFLPAGVLVLATWKGLVFIFTGKPFTVETYSIDCSGYIYLYNGFDKGIQVESISVSVPRLRSKHKEGLVISHLEQCREAEDSQNDARKHISPGEVREIKLTTQLPKKATIYISASKLTLVKGDRWSCFERIAILLRSGKTKKFWRMSGLSFLYDQFEKWYWITHPIGGRHFDIRLNNLTRGESNGICPDPGIKDLF